MANSEHTDATRLARAEQALGSLTGETTLTTSDLRRAAFAAHSPDNNAAAVSASSDSTPIIDTLFTDGWTRLAESGSAPTLSGSEQPVMVQRVGNSGQADDSEEGHRMRDLTSVKPTLTLDPIMEDNAVGCQEGLYGMQISGSSTHLPGGATVTVTLNGVSYQGMVENDGHWYVSLTDTELGTIPDGIYTVAVSATDPSGNVATASADVTLITHWESLPDIHFDNVTSDNVINALELQQALTLTGSLTRVLPGQKLYIDDGGNKDYEAMVQADGRWILEIPADEVADFIHRGELHAWARDGAGNYVDGQFDFDIITTLPPVYYELDIGGDTLLDYQEAQSDLSFYIEGITSLTLNGKTYEPVAGMVTLSSEDLLALPDGPVDVTVWQQDEYGNSATSTLSNFFTVATHASPAVASERTAEAHLPDNGDIDSWLNTLSPDSPGSAREPGSESSDATLLARLQGDGGQWQTQHLPGTESTLTSEMTVTLADLLQEHHATQTLV